MDGFKCKDGFYRGQYKSGGEKFVNGQHEISAQVESLFDGVGVLKYKDGQVYEGQFKNGVREGTGRLVYVNGKSFEGEWKNDSANGEGIY